ncbi:hypothetical protein [Sporosarcina phage Lietuvens]|nr:hypothetical protein [Sporosarcina phage Lietuvens]
MYELLTQDDEYTTQYDEAKTVDLQYNGALDADCDPADYYVNYKGVLIA